MQIYYDDYLEHHGIKGQRWGIRRYQNPDGSLTEAGKKRYTDGTGPNKYGWYTLNKRGVKAARKAEKRAKKILETDRAKNIIKSRSAELQDLSNKIAKASYELENIYVELLDDESTWVENQPKYKKAQKVYDELNNKYMNTIKEITKDIKLDDIGDFDYNESHFSEYEKQVGLAVTRMRYLQRR